MYINKKQLEKGEFGETVKFSPLFNRARTTVTSEHNLFRSLAEKGISIKQNSDDNRPHVNKLSGENETKFRDMFFKAGHGIIIKESGLKKGKGVEIHSKMGRKDENAYLSI